MPTPDVPLEKLGFLTLGTFDGDDPGPGMESTLQVAELGEQLGFDSVYLRHRHFQTGISSPIAIMAALSQRTSRIAMGTAVTPLGWENPLRMAEDLATVDILSGGRLEPGFSVGPPIHWDDVKAALYPDTADREDLTYERVARLLRMIRGEAVSTFEGTAGFEEFSARVEPHSPGLGDRIWYGAGSKRSTQWAAEQGLNLLTSNIIKPEDGDLEQDGKWDFAAIQQRQIALFKAHHSDGDGARVSQGLVVIPTDSATPEQRAKYEAYVEKRTPRTSAPMGPPGPGLLAAPDVLGTSDEVAEKLYADAAFREVREVVFALPFTFEHEDYVQVLTDMATKLGPALGWKPSA
ncbi:alkanesulfonate monooxygenase SsuD/methylene tetrahydromethanopterin reductase-like flavin-dependent oxidoreductase (luciferase family) [Actinomycetospora succinea]|uniref:Alkanesulfonate monooxygenase SsuD/methylene tetrahydromethanopterin reductase-like flavin-dependent oxidoreductase (Luciferase family) n=1 Tax=Actinomycetospora succinea TaxID=663603 RepID=A0A4V3DAI8_9PSEU|nr:LLM class flavin-dependent oxidoreductase [Actinomycetospora succinea]TDQ62493.1 alkanesulfonate monooxygenase SsuD/methylene tetrahydromethanopterin reductase-like flavin-dependent oxidoreductase (luciferase family) [Actinomycetospora succinea]